MEERTLQTKQCTQCGKSFSITDQDDVLYQKLTPIIGGKSYPLPYPTHCPDCRQQRRLARRNERKLYHDICDLTGRSMISLYSPDKPYKVYHHSVRRGDQRDPMDYGRDMDFSQPFFPQFKSLHMQVPKIATFNKNTENTEYGNNLIDDKNSYMLFVTSSNEDCYYGFTVGYCKNCVDSLWTVQCQNCYECVRTQNCYECFRCVNAQNCFSSQYLRDCGNVDSSAYCIGLRNKKYCFLNGQYTKEAYKAICAKLATDQLFLQETKEQFAQLQEKTPVKANIIEECENVTGEYLNNCKNCYHCFDTMLAEDGRYLYDCVNIADGMDQYLGGAQFNSSPSQLVYESENSFNIHHVYFCSTVTFGSQDMFYCDACQGCKHCFGCVGLTRKEYCVFNKQYTKEAYEEIVPKIIDHMIQTGERGEFFPIELSPFAYNETEAQTYYPLTQTEAQAKGWQRYGPTETNLPPESQSLSPEDFPPIQEVRDDILDKILICETTGAPFKLIKQELVFYRKYQLPLPKHCPDQRHLDRMLLKNPRTIYASVCSKCGRAITTAYVGVSPAIYCESCYMHEMY